jgi:hypothetical protein
MTKKLRTWLIILVVLSFLLNVGPVAAYAIMGLVEGTLLIEKVALSMTIFVVAILSVIAWANKLVLRSRLWILLAGLFFVLDAFAAPLIIIGACQVLDELIVSPIKHRVRTRYTINKEMDRRGV